MKDGGLNRFWKEKITGPLMAQLTQGVTPHHLALSCALGTVLGIFPILGSTTLLCFLAGVLLKLNQPAIQAVNYLVYPVQLLCLPIFIRYGEKLFHADPITFSPLQLTREFSQSPSLFMTKYAAAGFYGIVIWALTAPFLLGGLYALLSTTFKKMVLLQKRNS
jgi:uncharacterized protein (DUF2062 family)